MNQIKTITLPEFAAALGVKPKTLQNRYSRHPEDLPPRIRLPGHNQPLFFLRDIHAWMNRHRDIVETPTEMLGRGRPTKAKEIAGRSRVTDASFTRRSQ